MSAWVFSRSIAAAHRSRARSSILPLRSACSMHASRTSEPRAAYYASGRPPEPCKPIRRRRCRFCSTRSVPPRCAGASFGAVVHRIVHGGERFIRPTLIDDACSTTWMRSASLAPLHNPPAVAAVRAARAAFPTSLISRFFDTAFHAPCRGVRASTHYRRTRQSLRIRRYGFHGISHTRDATRCQLALASMPRSCGSSRVILATGRASRRSSTAAVSRPAWA